MIDPSNLHLPLRGLLMNGEDENNPSILVLRITSGWWYLDLCKRVVYL